MANNIRYLILHKIIPNGVDWYLMGLNGQSISTSSNPQSAIIFESELDARRYIVNSGYKRAENERFQIVGFPLIAPTTL